MCFARKGPAQDAFVGAVDKTAGHQRHFPEYVGKARPSTMGTPSASAKSSAPTPMASVQQSQRNRTRQMLGTYANKRMIA